MDRLKLLEESLTEYRHDLEAGPASALQASSIYLINVMFETIDDMLAVARAARALEQQRGWWLVANSKGYGVCVICNREVREGHGKNCEVAKLQAALAALEGDKQGEGKA